MQYLKIFKFLHHVLHAVLEHGSEIVWFSSYFCFQFYKS